MFSLKNFRSYQMSLALYRKCEHIKSKHYLKDQLLRASLSVCLNLAEGSAKSSIKDRKRFYGIALASLRETQSILEIINSEIEVRQLANNVGGCVYRLVYAQAKPELRAGP